MKTSSKSINRAGNGVAAIGAILVLVGVALIPFTGGLSATLVLCEVGGVATAVGAVTGIATVGGKPKKFKQVHSDQAKSDKKPR